MAPPEVATVNSNPACCQPSHTSAVFRWEENTKKSACKLSSNCVTSYCFNIPLFHTFGCIATLYWLSAFVNSVYAPTVLLGQADCTRLSRNRWESPLTYPQGSWAKTNHTLSNTLTSISQMSTHTHVLRLDIYSHLMTVETCAHTLEFLWLDSFL